MYSFFYEGQIRFMHSLNKIYENLLQNKYIFSIKTI